MPTLLIILACLAWGWSFVGVKDAVALCDPLWFVAIRLGLAAVLLLPIALLLRQLDRRTVLLSALIGLPLAATFVLQTIGLRESSASNAGLITGLFVVSTPIADWLLYRRTARLGDLIAIPISLLGLALLTGQAPTGFTRSDGLVLLAAVASGVHIAMVSRHAASLPWFALVAVQIGICALISLVLAHAFASGPAPGFPASPRLWCIIAAAALLPTAFAFAVQAYAQRRIAASRAALLYTLEPIFGVLCGASLHGDVLFAWQWAGAGLIVGALVVGELISALRRGPQA